MSAKPTRNADGIATSARELRRQNKIRQIVEAAREVFLQEGFSGASMDLIVQKAGVSKRTTGAGGGTGRSWRTSCLSCVYPPVYPAARISARSRTAESAG